MSSRAFSLDNRRFKRSGRTESALAFAASLRCSRPTLSASRSEGVGSDFKDSRNSKLRMTIILHYIKDCVMRGLRSRHRDDRLRFL